VRKSSYVLWFPLSNQHHKHEAKLMNSRIRAVSEAVPTGSFVDGVVTLGKFVVIGKFVVRRDCHFDIHAVTAYLLQQIERLPSA
jgi:hypothetical protein